MHVDDISNINLKVVENLDKFKNRYQILNIKNKKEYSNFEVLNSLTKIMKKKPIIDLKQIDNKESIQQIINTKNDILKIIKYNIKYKDLKKILQTNSRWFKKIY